MPRLRAFIVERQWHLACANPACTSSSRRLSRSAARRGMLTSRRPADAFALFRAWGLQMRSAVDLAVLARALHAHLFPYWGISVWEVLVHPEWWPMLLRGALRRLPFHGQIALQEMLATLSGCFLRKEEQTADWGVLRRAPLPAPTVQCA